MRRAMVLLVMAACGGGSDRPAAEPAPVADEPRVATDGPMVATDEPAPAEDEHPLVAEVLRHFHRIERALRAYHARHGTLPVGRAPEMSATTCCAQLDGMCRYDAAMWSAVAWSALDFSVEGRSRFRFAYESDGSSATATAVVDADCDGVSVTFEITMDVDHDAGVLHVSIVRPQLLD